ncbi:MAG: DsrE family protein, partial [Bacteroidia bacterium]|nr:DsrE family protein [Bacteroidia bacterium]
MQKVVMIFNREPYDQTDVTWNGLRLAEALRKKGIEVGIFLMNDAVDLARDACKPPEGYDHDLSEMLRELIAKDVPVEV